MNDFFEAAMIICFGVSWPISIYKSFKSKTSKGKSPYFLLFIFSGYCFGCVSKILSGNLTYVLFFYILNGIMVFIDIILYLRNKQLDKK